MTRLPQFGATESTLHNFTLSNSKANILIILCILHQHLEKKDKWVNIYSKIKYLGNHSLNRNVDINKKSEKVMRIQSSEMLFNCYVAPKFT